jgi:hypothetical protein
MQLRVEIIPAADGWDVYFRDVAAGQWLEVNPGEKLVRKLRKVGAGGRTFPLPPAEDLAGIADEGPPGNTLCSLCGATDPQTINRLFTKIIGRNPGLSGVRLFGRYLFEALLGSAIWQGLRALPRPLELALAWRRDDAAINRLPWEMMCAPSGFLLQAPQLAITRRVPRSAGHAAPLAPLAIKSPPRVLFVIGTKISDDVIRPGVEYLGLLRALRNDDLGIKPLLLLDATPKRLAKALETFDPDVVHFISHGGVSETGVPYLVLQDDPDGATIAANEPLPLNLPGENLALLLEKNPPQIVVLNACYTATADDIPLEGVGQVGSPLAVTLVDAGIPVVIGMAGQVSDRACRLFTRQFYLSLLRDGDIGAATAEGRRAGIIEETARPQDSVDWAMPTLFLAEDMAASTVPIARQPMEVRWQRAAKEYLEEEYPPLCDRLDSLRMYEILMSRADVQRVTSPHRKSFRILGMARPAADDNYRYGKSKLLRELAALALREGHVPVLLRKETALDPLEYVKTPQALLRLLHQAVRITARRLDVRDAANNPWNPDVLGSLISLRAGDALPPEFPAECIGILKAALNDYEDREVRACVVKTVLSTLLQLARQQRDDLEPKEMRLVLLVDDVHLMGSTTICFLLDTLLGEMGLGAPDVAEDFRAVFTYNPPLVAGQMDPADTIRTWIQQHEQNIELLTLPAFQDSETRLAYGCFLLHWRQAAGAGAGWGRPHPLVIMEETDYQRTATRALMRNFKQKIMGVPQLIPEVGPRIVEEFLTMQSEGLISPPFLFDANDDDMLAAGPAGIGGAGGVP